MKFEFFAAHFMTDSMLNCVKQQNISYKFKQLQNICEKIIIRHQETHFSLITCYYVSYFVENFKTFSTDYGHSSAFSLSEALWTCQNMFATRYVQMYELLRKFWRSC